MASVGPLYPGTVTTEIGPSGDNDWLTPGNISADDAAEAQITAATYDAADHSYRLKAQNFGFAIQAGATINGITVEIDRRAFAGAAQDQEVRLYNAAGTLVGDDKQTATAWPATLGIATYGGSADTWAAGLTVTDVNDPDFGVALIVLADAANTDIGVDFIRVTIEWSSGAVTLTPPVAALTTSAFAPTVTATNNILVTPPVRALVTATFAPLVTVATIITPPVRALVTTAFAPTATVTNHVLITVPVRALVTATFAPTVLLPRLVTVPVRALSLATFAPTVSVSGGSGVTVTPGAASLVLAGFAPLVLAPRLVIPGTQALVLSTFVPTVLTPRLVTPGVTVLTLSTFAPTVTLGSIVSGGPPPSFIARFQLPKLRASRSTPEI